MMLRFIYFVSLLLCLSLSEEEFLRPRKRHIRNRYKKDKIIRKRENYRTLDDKESMDYIDVASFIQNPDDISFDSNQVSENSIPSLKDYADDNPIMNMEVERDRSQDYQGLESDNIPEVNIYNSRRIPQYLNKKGRPRDEINSEYLLKANVVKNSNLNENSLFGSNLKHRHAQKKCALRNMKIPFFSRDKVSTTKAKKNKKRKIFSFHNTKKNSTRASAINFNNNINKEIAVKRQSIKLNKRSDSENKCQACKQRKILNSNDFLENIRKTAHTGIHNCRQYYQKKDSEKAERENKIHRNSFGIKQQDHNADNKDSFDLINSNRWRRNDDILINKTRKKLKPKNI